jgi:hypothetical protein
MTAGDTCLLSYFNNMDHNHIGGDFMDSTTYFDISGTTWNKQN